MGLAVKNNNPGNLRDPSTGNFRTFNTPEDGYAALMNDLSGKIKGATSTGLHGGSTIYDFAQKWAPSSDNNDPAQYAVNLANQLKIRPDSTLAELKQRVPDFAYAIANNEDRDFAKNNPLNFPKQQPASQSQTPDTQTPQVPHDSSMLRDAQGNYLGGIIPDNTMLQKGVNFLGGVAADVASPFAKLGSKLTGLPAYNPISGETEETPQTLLQTAGAAGEGLLNVATAGQGGAALQAGKKGILPFLKAGVKSGTALGAGYGLTGAVQQTTDPGEIAKQTALGAGIGAGLGFLTGGIGALGNKLSGATEKAIGKVTDAIKSGDDNAVVAAQSTPEYQAYLKSIGAETPEKVNQTIAKVADEIRTKAMESNRVALQPWVTREDFDNTIKTVLENAQDIKMQGNKVNWAPTEESIEKKIKQYSTVQDDVLRNTDIDTSFGITPQEYMQSVRKSLQESVAKGFTRADEAEGVLKSAQSEITSRFEKGVTLSDLTALRRIGNADFGGDSVKAKANQLLASATRGMLTKRAENPLQYGITPQHVQLLNDYQAVYDQLIKLNQAKDFLKVWKYEPVLKGTGTLDQVAGALGFAGTGNFFGYLGARALSDRLQSSYMKQVVKGLYQNEAIKHAAGKTPEKAGKNLMKSLESLGKKQQAKAAAKVSERVTPRAVVKPSEYEPYTQPRTIQMGDGKAPQPSKVVRTQEQDKNLPVIDYAAKDTHAEATLAAQKEAERYKSDKELPVIDAGATPKSKYTKSDKNLPSISYAAAPFAAVSLLDKLKNLGKESYVREKEPVKEKDYTVIKDIAHAETRGEKNPYSFSQPSGNSKYGDALGKYQITSARLKEKSKAFLGKLVSDKEFLTSPELQDKFMQAQVDWLRSHGLSDKEIKAVHRGGWGDLSKEHLAKVTKEREDYIASSTKKD